MFRGPCERRRLSLCDSCLLLGHVVCVRAIHDISNISVCYACVPLWVMSHFWVSHATCVRVVWRVVWLTHICDMTRRARAREHEREREEMSMREREQQCEGKWARDSKAKNQARVPRREEGEVWFCCFCGYASVWRVYVCVCPSVCGHACLHLCREKGRERDICNLCRSWLQSVKCQHLSMPGLRMPGRVALSIDT